MSIWGSLVWFDDDQYEPDHRSGGRAAGHGPSPYADFHTTAPDYAGPAWCAPTGKASYYSARGAGDWRQPGRGGVFGLHVSGSCDLVRVDFTPSSDGDDRLYLDLDQAELLVERLGDWLKRRRAELAGES